MPSSTATCRRRQEPLHIPAARRRAGDPLPSLRLTPEGRILRQMELGAALIAKNMGPSAAPDVGGVWEYERWQQNDAVWAAQARAILAGAETLPPRPELPGPVQAAAAGPAQRPGPPPLSEGEPEEAATVDCRRLELHGRADIDGLYAEFVQLLCARILRDGRIDILYDVFTAPLVEDRLAKAADTAAAAAVLCKLTPGQRLQILTLTLPAFAPEDGGLASLLDTLSPLPKLARLRFSQVTFDASAVTKLAKLLPMWRQLFQLDLREAALSPAQALQLLAAAEGPAQILLAAHSRSPKVDKVLKAHDTTVHIARQDAAWQRHNAERRERMQETNACFEELAAGRRRLTRPLSPPTRPAPEAPLPLWPERIWPTGFQDITGRYAKRLRQWQTQLDTKGEHDVAYHLFRQDLVELQFALCRTNADWQEVMAELTRKGERKFIETLTLRAIPGLGPQLKEVLAALGPAPRSLLALEISCLRLTQDGVDALCKVLPEWPNLTALNVADTGLDAAQVLQLSAALPHLINLNYGDVPMQLSQRAAVGARVEQALQTQRRATDKRIETRLRREARVAEVRHDLARLLATLQPLEAAVETLD